MDQDNDTLKQILKNGVGRHNFEIKKKELILRKYIFLNELLFIVGKQLPMTVYSSKTQSVRSVTIEPSETWGGQGLLGVSIRFCSFEGANENVWHVLEVHPSSPAELAGLHSFTDYIIGADSVLHESEDLFTLIEAHEDKSLKLYVYNSEDDTCREVTIIPNSKWGGEGSLGCGIGYGYLHRIPIRICPPTTATTTIYKQFSMQNPTNVNTSNVLPVCSVSSNIIEFNTSKETNQNQQTIPAATFGNVPNSTTLNTSNVSANTITVSSINEQISSPTSAFSTPPFSHVNIPYIPPTSNINTVPFAVPSMPYIPSSSSAFSAPVIQNVPSTKPANIPDVNAYGVVPNIVSQVSSIPMYNPAAMPQATPAPIFTPAINSYTPNPLIFDPDLAARSAQQLLTSERNTQ